MPTYTFRDTVTGLEEDLVMKISQLDEFYKNNPTKVQVIGVPNFVSSTGGSFETKAGDEDADARQYRNLRHRVDRHPQRVQHETPLGLGRSRA